MINKFLGLFTFAFFQFSVLLAMPKNEVVTMNQKDVKHKIALLIEKDVLENCVKLFDSTFHKFKNDNKLAFEIKCDGSLVSNLEKNVELVIADFLQEMTPWASFQGEEGTFYEARDGTTSFKWYLDPIDGTTSFRNGLDTFAFTLTLVENNKAIATTVYFPCLKKTYIAYSGLGVTLNNEPISMENIHLDDKAIIAISDDYTFDLTDRAAVLQELRKLPYIPRTITDIHGYCLVAEGKCIAKFDAAGALWDLWPGHLLIEEAGGKCLFFPVKNPTEDLAGSMLVGHPEVIQNVYERLQATIHHEVLCPPSSNPHMTKS